MTAQRPGIFTRIIDALPGWVCVAGGAVLLAMFALTPQWLMCRDVAWHRDLMRQQAAALEAQLDRYRQFHLALVEDDPILLERLAFAELRRKPAGHELYDPDPGIFLAYQQHLLPDEGEVVTVGAAPPLSLPGSIHAWLRVPMPVVGQDIEPLPPLESHLTRISTGPFRLIAVIGAIGVMAMGVMLQVKDPAR
jgi:hypothetical protein